MCVTSRGRHTDKPHEYISVFFLTYRYLIRQSMKLFLYSCCGIKGTVAKTCSRLLESFNGQILERKNWGETVRFGSHTDRTASNHDSCRITTPPSKMLVFMACTKTDWQANAPAVCCAGSFSCAELKNSVVPKPGTIQHIRLYWSFQQSYMDYFTLLLCLF